MQLPSFPLSGTTADDAARITPIRHAGHNALRLKNRHGTAIVALHGGHLMSWVPTEQRDVFWVSPASLPEPAAIRGGVPVCWPWFARQGQPATAVQHGPVRNTPWQVTEVHHCTEGGISLTLEPVAQACGHTMEGVPPGLRVSVTITMGQTLRQTLHTRNPGAEPFELSQALHSYYAVSDAEQVSIEGLRGLPYTDRLRDLARDVQRDEFALDQACDRTYEQPASEQHYSYTLADPVWQRRICISVEGSRSVVVWNPGRETARKMVDVPDDGWPGFFCIEAANAGPDVIALAPGAEHRLTQTLSVMD